jgi:uncharacterized protein YukE
LGLAILINTAAVSATAEQIDTLNRSMRDDLSDIDSAIRSMRQVWGGEAATSSVNKYDYIKRSFSDTRYSVVNGLVSFMKRQVGEGYDTTEQKVSTAASAFK